MAEPLPPDPYIALAVPKTADIGAIRSAHRKLVLKFHPDRIKNEEDRERGRIEFEKAQQAYELLSDPIQRERYDNRVKLEELKKEAMMREPPSRSATYPGRPSQSTPYREYRADAVYEERVPAGFYPDNRDRFDDEEFFSRASARKFDDYERRTSGRNVEKEKKPRGKWDGPIEGMSFKMASHIKKKAASAKERVQESKMREREEFASKSRARDRDERQNRSEKQRHAFVEDDSSDSDTATQVTNSTIRPARPSSKSKTRPETPSKRSSGSRHTIVEEGEEEDSYDDVDKYERMHQQSQEYQKQTRPTVSRTDSYWQNEEARRGSRRSGSDSDKRPTSSKGRRSDGKEAKPRPPMPMHTSAPDYLRAHVETREPREPQMRSSTTTNLPREKEHRREMPPTFERAHTMPTPRSSKKDSVPARGSNLKHTETQDSGYGSSSSPHTPDMSGDSPTRESRRELPRQTSTKYAIVDPVNEGDDDEDYSRKPRTVLIDQEEDYRRHRRSPSPQLRERERRSGRPERPRLVTTDSGRSRSGRVSSGQASVDAKPERPANLHRDSRFAQPHSPHGSPPPPSRTNSGRGAFSQEILPDDNREPSHTHRYVPETVRTAPRVDPEQVNYAKYKRRGSADDRTDRDYTPNSRHREDLKSNRRPSVYT